MAMFICPAMEMGLQKRRETWQWGSGGLNLAISLRNLVIAHYAELAGV
jgi:hypothetical protein